MGTRDRLATKEKRKTEAWRRACHNFVERNVYEDRSTNREGIPREAMYLAQDLKEGPGNMDIEVDLLADYQSEIEQHLGIHVYFLSSRVNPDALGQK